jgi:exodeoxyribonuclease (lambda-induced)
MNAQFMQVEQSSDAWLKMRLGVITASCAHDLIPTITEKEAVYSKKDPTVMLHPASKKVTFKQARQTYMDQLIAEVCTGRGEEINAKALSWGKENEVAARAAYSFESGEKIQDGGFIYGMDKRVGASPDGIVVGKNKGLELKAPYSSDTHIAFLLHDEVKPEYVTQVQWSMWVSGFDFWDFASFDPRMKKNMIKIVTFKRDEEMMKMFSEIVPQFIKEMDAHLEKIGMSFGSQWT